MLLFKWYEEKRTRCTVIDTLFFVIAVGVVKLVLLHEEDKSPDMLDHAKTKTTHVASVIVTKHIL